MTRHVHDTINPRPESARARAAWFAYRDTPPGQRSLERLCQRFKEQAALHQTDPTIPPPPTTDINTLKLWSARWGWVARCAAHDAEMDSARKAEMRAQVEQHARDNARLLQQVGQGALALAALTLNDVIDSKTGALRRPLEPRDLPPLMKSGAELLALACGTPTHIVSAQDNASLEHCLRLAPEDTRRLVLQGLRAALEWQQRHGG
jgi:hypothetical protein